MADDIANDIIKDDSPYPSQADMDLDMWRASRPMPDRSRLIKGVDEVTVARVPYHGESTAARDATARRIEQLGDLYEALRQATEKMAQAGMDTSREALVLTDFVSPKPFPEGN